MSDPLCTDMLAEAVEMRAEIERLRAYAKHERSLGAEGPMLELVGVRQENERLRAAVKFYEDNDTALVNTLRAERDELLAALKRLASDSNFSVVGHVASCGCCVCEARVAIAKMESEK
jgi:hypothetical protein